MAANLPVATLKPAVHNTSPSVPQSSAAAAASGDYFGQRRAGGSGSFGSGATTRASSSPRNGQGQRKSNKSSKRYHRFADEDAMAETTAIRSSSSRKGQTSITHLMNFSLPPRPQPYHHYSSHHHGRQQRRNHTWGLGSGYHAVDKARYVHANYRFIVDPRGDYHAQSVDADVHLDWDKILQILVSSKSQQVSCPICLSHPTAPRMSKCGHIACLTCLLRYKQADDSEKVQGKGPKWVKCPICEDSIYISDTRPVRWFAGQEGDAPHEGSDVVLRLVARPAGSTLALPRDGAASLSKEEDIPWHLATEVMDYARIMKGSEDYVIEQYDSDIRDIEAQEKEDELMYGDDTAEWSRKAYRLITEAKDKAKGMGNPPATPIKPAEPRAYKSPADFGMASIHNASVQRPQSWDRLDRGLADGSTHLAVPKSEDVMTATAEISTSENILPQTALYPPPGLVSHTAVDPRTATLEIRSRQQQQQGHGAPSDYYFYQALLHYYLSPLDIRILKEAFGAFSSFPSTILPRVEHVSTGHIVDDDLRKRIKYLAHLPYGCEVSFLECDWTDTVSAVVLDKFKKDIDARRKRNQDRDARDEKARLTAEQREEQRYSFARRRRGTSPDAGRFQTDDFRPLNGEAFSSGEEALSQSPPWAARREQGSQFASLASPGTSPSASRTVWGTPAVAPHSPLLDATPLEPQQADDGWIQNWEHMLLQEDQLVAQMQSLSVEGESSKAGSSGGGKKKKAKKITLMSTNARRGA